MPSQTTAFKIVFVLSFSMLACVVFGVAAIALSGYSMGIEHVKAHAIVYFVILVLTLAISIQSGVAYRKSLELHS